MRKVLTKIAKKPFNFVGLDLVKLRKFTDFTQSEHSKSGKIFGIGWNKTGTTSLNQLMKDLGFKVAPQIEQELLLTQNVLNGNYSDLAGFVDRFDFFQDLPFSQGLSFVACDAIFPNSKFILTVRDEDEWFRSLYNFHKKVFNFKNKEEVNESFFKDKNVYLAKNYGYENIKRLLTFVDGFTPYEDWSYIYDERYYKDLYRNRNNDIIKYFKERPGDLLVIDLTAEKDNIKIIEFLDLPAALVGKIPHENKT